MAKKLPANAEDARDVGLIPGLGRSPGGGNGNPLQYSCLGNPVDRGAWRATVHGVAKSQTQLLWVLGMQTLMTQLTPRHFQSHHHHQLHATQGSEFTFISIRHFSERVHTKRKIEVLTSKSQLQKVDSGLGQESIFPL